MALLRSAKVAFDCAGHSSRRDQLKLSIEPAEEYDEATADQDHGFDAGNKPLDHDRAD
jgi:hypothetical protein